MKSAIQLGQLFIVVLTISVAAIFFAGLGCQKESGLAPEISLQEEGATEGEATTERVVYVKQGQSGNGTKDSPMGDISQAIAYAKSTWSTPSEVHVAKGIYEVESGSTHIVMVEGISLLGGYSAIDWTRDPSVYVTTIKDISSSSVLGEPNRAVEFGSGITAATVIDGFYIQGVDGHFSCAVYNHDAAPTISNNKIVAGGQGAGIGELATYGIFNKNSSPIISNNEINGSSTGNPLMTAAIFNDNSSGTTKGNAISGGGATHAAGIANQGNSSPNIYNNTIDGGSGSSTFGIVNEYYCSAKIFNNTIDGGSGVNSSYGIWNAGGSAPVIANNIISAPSSSLGYGIYENDNQSDPAEVKNNDVFDCSKALYYDFDTASNFNDICGNGTFGVSVCVILALVTPMGLDNVMDDPKLDGDLHFTTDSPTKVTQGGLDLSSIIEAKDKDGKPRTPPWSMGAYELD